MLIWDNVEVFSSIFIQWRSLNKKGVDYLSKSSIIPEWNPERMKYKTICSWPTYALAKIATLSTHLAAINSAFGAQPLTSL